MCSSDLVTVNVLQDIRGSITGDWPSSQTVILKYRALTILNQVFNNTIARTFVAIYKTTTECYTPIAIVICLKLNTNFASILFQLIVLSIVVMLLIVEFGIVFLLSETHQTSAAVKKRLLNSSVTVVDRKLAKVLHRSCRVLRNQVGSFYYIDRALILTILHSKIDSIIFLLLNF